MSGNQSAGILPNFLIIGAPRCGSTWLARNLMLHPDIFIPVQKELRFFTLDYKKGLDYYASLFEDYQGEKMAGDATPHYMYAENGPEKINQSLPGVKLIAILRNPVDRFLSDHLIKLSDEHGLGLEEIKKKIETSKDSVTFNKGLYYPYLKSYQEIFGRDRLLILLYDDLLTDSGGLLKTAYEYLDVDPNFESPLADFQMNSAFSTARSGKFVGYWLLHRIFFWMRLYKLSEYFEKINRIEADGWPEGYREWLAQQYQQPNIELGKFLNRDLSAWR